MSNSGPRVPEFVITGIDSEKDKLSVKKIVVDSVHDGPDMFELTFVNKSDSDGNAHDFTDSAGKNNAKLKKFGDPIEIKLGFVEGGQETVVKGEVTGLETIYRSDGPSELIVRGYDKLHRMTRGRKQRTFLNKKDSDIAKLVAKDSGLSLNATDSKIVHDHVFQNNLSDLKFLYSRARAIGFEVALEDDKLVFAPPRVTKSAVGTLALDGEIQSARLRISTTQQVKEVQVRGWDPIKKKEILGKSKSGEEYSKMGGSKAGSAIVNSQYKVGGSAIETVVNVPIKDQSHANSIAKGRLNSLALNLIQGEVLTLGNNKLVAGKIVTLELCDTFSGDYYITRALHTIDASSSNLGGYYTKLTVKSAGTKAK